MTLPTDIAVQNRRAVREAALAYQKDLKGLDDFESTAPCGHAKGLGISTRLTSNYRQTHRHTSRDVQPQQVIDCLIKTGVKNWCQKLVSKTGVKNWCQKLVSKTGV